MGVDPASLAIKAGMMALQMGLTAMNRTEGPRLDSLDVTTADYGTPLNYFWGKRRLEGVPIIWAEKLREKKVTTKTKGGKYGEYKYYGTFAVAIADHQIDAVSRIWMDKHLVYDVTKPGPISPMLGFFASIASDVPVKITNGRNMRIYTGSETQEPDPRMVEWCEDRYGADSCPAYRGVAYIVFQHIPLEKFGNRIPQITVEAVNNAATSYLHEDFTAAGGLGPVFSRDHTRALFYDSNDSEYAIWDVPTQSKIIDSVLPTDVEEVAYNANGKIWVLCGTLGDTLRLLAPDGLSVETEIALGQFTDRLHGIGNNAYLRPKAGAATNVIWCNADSCTTIDTDFTPEMYFEDLDGNAWAIGMDGTNIRLYNVDTAADHTIASPGGVTGFCSGMVNSNGDFFVMVQTTAVLIEASAPTVVADSVDIGGAASEHFDVMPRMVPGSSRFYTKTKEIDSGTLDTIQTYAMTDWVAGNTILIAYEPATHALWGRALGSATVTIRYLDRKDSAGTDLADVIQDVADRCGVVELDVSSLTQTVPGYSTVQGAGKDWISPLIDIHDIDARPHNFAVQFLARGSSPAGTIPVTEFVRDGDEPRYQFTIKQDTDLPVRLSLNFADGDKDQQKNTVISQRPLDGTDSARELTIDLSTYVATPGDAQKFADRYFRRKWNGREQVTNSLTAQYLALEPGDVWNLQLDDVTQSHRLVKATLTQGRIQTEWERDFASLHTLGTGAGAAMDGRDDDEIYIPSATKGFVLDIPLVQDADNNINPLLYYAAGSYGGDWPGAVAFQADVDGDEFIAWNAVDSVDKANWGYALGALPDANPNLWDRGSSVNINVKGTLTSSTEAAIDANPMVNLAYLGGELFNFATATLEADGTHTLSILKRGRRGTEGFVSTHAAGDEFVLVSDLDNDGLGLSEVGVSRAYRVQTLGRDVDSAPDIDIDFTGATLKPYAPARLKWVFDGTDLLGTITRRTRVGGAWTSGGATIPLSEDSEAYEVDIYNGATLKRTITVTGTNTFTYTAAMAATDGITLPTPPSTATAQMSSDVGRGFYLIAA